MNMPVPAYILFLALCVWGCPYRIRARHEMPFRNIYVDSFANRTVERGIGHDLTVFVKESIIERTTSNIVSDRKNADVLTGIIQEIGRDIISEDAAGSAVVERINVEIEVALQAGDKSIRVFRVIGTAVHEKTGLVSRDRLVRKALQDAARRIIDLLINVPSEHIMEISSDE